MQKKKNGNKSEKMGRLQEKNGTFARGDLEQLLYEFTVNKIIIHGQNMKLFMTMMMVIITHFH